MHFLLQIMINVYTLFLFLMVNCLEDKKKSKLNTNWSYQVYWLTSIKAVFRSLCFNPLHLPQRIVKDSGFDSEYMGYMTFFLCKFLGAINICVCIWLANSVFQYHSAPFHFAVSSRTEHGVHRLARLSGIETMRIT